MAVSAVAPAGAQPEVEWWWVVGVFVAVALSALVPIATAAFGPGRYGDKSKSEDKPKAATRDSRGDADEAVSHRPLEEEPWAPKLEIKDWQSASELPGCPWNFDDCSGLSEALERIWRKPLCADLQSGFDALKPRVRNLQIARVTVTMPRAVHFAVVYTLNTGAELFGGAPAEHAVGLDMGDDASVGSAGLRRRRGSASPEKGSSTEAFSTPLPCLLPFYRIHDGFGVLLVLKHLPLLLASPGDSVAGSCFYVYPARGLEPVAARGDLLKFARVDKACLACARAGLEEPCVVYVERGGETTEDDEHPLCFIADTVSNIAGQRVVPPMYMSGLRQ
mmetsp:Transcript_123869/g.358247  ORF Transcript_123869/g.358247 Transcript_123869/m.358247 type:complete len:334 (+) Transcript_123869:80-1081(+)